MPLHTLLKRQCGETADNSTSSSPLSHPSALLEFIVQRYEQAAKTVAPGIPQPERIPDER